MSSAKKSHTNFYLTLDIMPGVAQSEILHAYKRAKMTYAGGSLASYSLLEGDNHQSILDEIEEAFSTLGSPALRREYDLKMGFSTWTDKNEGESGGEIDTSGASHSRPSIMSTRAGSPSVQDFDPMGEIRYTTEESSAPANVAKHTTQAAHMRIVSAPKPQVEEMPDIVGNPEFEDKIKTCEQIDGAFLKAVRLYRKMNVDQLSTRTKISAQRIEAIEEESTQDYGQPVYLRGHVAIVCKTLNLPEPEKLARTYLEHLKNLGRLPSSDL